jgi:hypothetical protein
MGHVSFELYIMHDLHSAKGTQSREKASFNNTTDYCHCQYNTLPGDKSKVYGEFI